MKKNQFSILLIFVLALSIFSSCNNDDDSNTAPQVHVFELSINVAKDGQKDAFFNTRTQYLTEVNQESASLSSGTWNPFFTVIPDLTLDEILIGLTHWNSIQGFEETYARLIGQEAGQNYTATFDPLSHVILETLDGETFDMSTIQENGLVIEFAVRKGKTEDAFGAKREAFFNSLPNYDGYKFAREFKVYKLDANNKAVLQENTQAVMIVWENATKFNAAATPIFGTTEYQEFAEVIDVETYFATNPN